MTEKTATRLVTKSKSIPSPETAEVPNIEIRVVPFVLIGTSPLIVNCFSTKTQKQIADQQSGVEPRQKLGSKGKPPRIPKEEFEAARIRDAKGRDAFPCRYIKAALVTAAGMPGFVTSMKVTRQSVFVQGEYSLIEGPAPIMGQDMVRRGRWGAKQPMAAYRPYFMEWKLKIKIEFEPLIITHAWLVYLVRRAGLSVGLGEWRPEKNGEYGRFRVE